MSWHYSLTLVAEFSEGNYLDGEQCAQLKSKRIQEKSCFGDKRKDTLSPSPYGTTLQHSTVDLGVEKWMSSLEVSLVKTLVAPAKEKELPESDLAFGEKWLELLAKYDRDSSSWKTRQVCLNGELEQFSDNWPRWGTMSDGVCFQRAPLVHHIHERDCFYWHTPTANDCKPAGEAEVLQVKRWMDGKKVKNTYIRLRSLLAVRYGQRLPPNPEFLEWLMGFPIGWTEIKPLATDKFQSWLRQHGEF